MALIKRLAKRVILLTIVLLVYTNSLAQDKPTEQLDLSMELTEWYDAQVGKENPVLFQGKIANMERKSLSSHAYLGNLEWLLGEITFRNQEFQAVPLLFDLEKDVVLVLRGGENPYEMVIELKSDLVTEFEILDSKFIWMDAQAPNKSGFYEVLFEGEKLKFYAKRAKQLYKDGLDGFEYVQSDQYYLKYKDDYFAIRGTNSLERLFKKDRKLIKAFANQSSIRKLNNQTDKHFTLLIAYCDSLNL